MGRNLHKGQKVVVSGRLKWREWEQDGNKRQAVDIVADSVVPVVRDGDSRGGGQSNGYSARSDVPTDMSDFQPQQPATVGGGGARHSADDDIPF